MIYLITAYHQVARLQLQLLHAVAALPRSHQTTNALDMLNAELMHLSKVKYLCYKHINVLFQNGCFSGDWLC